MSRVYRVLVGICWGVGFLSLVAAIAMKLVPGLAEVVNAAPQDGLIFASVLFLCVLATREIGSLESSKT